MNTPTPFKITIENSQISVSSTLPYDSTIHEIMEVISGMLVSHTFSEKQIEDWVIERADILNQYYDRTTNTGQED
jgi:hypothetical protein